MKPQFFAKLIGIVMTLGIIITAGMFVRSPHVRADDDNDEAKVRIGFKIAPVPLKFAERDRELVGLGSYIVNGANDCNACHNGGAPPDFEYLAGGNPYNGEPKKLDPSVYLAGGQDFGPAGPPPSPDIITRNLTPDKTGRAEGGNTFEQFRQIMRTGKDFDHLHPNCSATITTNCIPPGSGINGDLLQIMPWPYFQSMTDHDLLAIYKYLSAIPCIDNTSGPPQLRNACH